MGHKKQIKTFLFLFSYLVLHYDDLQVYLIGHLKAPLTSRQGKAKQLHLYSTYIAFI